MIPGRREIFIRVSRRFFKILSIPEKSRVDSSLLVQERELKKPLRQEVGAAAKILSNFATAPNFVIVSSYLTLISHHLMMSIFNRPIQNPRKR